MIETIENSLSLGLTDEDKNTITSFLHQLFGVNKFAGDSANAHAKAKNELKTLEDAIDK